MTNTLRSIRRGPATPERVLVLIPGYGDTPEPFLDRASMFDPNEQWLVVVVEPQTPSERGPYWYNVDENGPDPDALASALTAIDSLCAALLAETKLSQDELVVVGFSQGGALALAHLVDPTSTVTPRAVAALASYLPSRMFVHAACAASGYEQCIGMKRGLIQQFNHPLFTFFEKTFHMRTRSDSHSYSACLIQKTINDGL
jgi:predicted esterase